MDHHVVAQEAHAGRTPRHAFRHEATCNLANTGDLEDLLDLGITDELLAHLGTEKSRSRRFHIVNKVIDGAAGFDHIIPKGADHILFVVGLFLFSTRMRPLLWQITMFTIAHSITLAMAMNGIIELPARVVEPLIALSIAYVGIENVWHRSLHKSRLVLVFAFGLLHGLGFASMLADFGMPDDAFFTALISFNLGVEGGQLAVVALAFLAVGLWFGKKPYYRQRIVVPGSLLIAAVGLYWTWERLSL